MQHRKAAPTDMPIAQPRADSTEAAPSPAARRRAARNIAVLYAAVALGSVIGAVLRALASLASLQLFGPALPWGTLFVNVTGSFAIGFFAELTGPDGRVIVGPRLRQFFMTGICGGFTTFSAFSLETFRFLQAGNLRAASMSVGLSIVAWLAAVWLGHVLAARFNRLKGR